MMAKKSFWKLPAALAISTALVFASCGGNDSSGIPVTDAGLGTSLEARTLSGDVYVWDAKGSLVPFKPSAAIPDITSNDLLSGAAGAISAQGQFSFILPQPLPADTPLAPFAQVIDMEDMPVSISNANAMGFAVLGFDSPGIWTPAANLYEGWLFRGNSGANFWEGVNFIYVDRDVTVALSQEFSEADYNGDPYTIIPFTINFSKGWNILHFKEVPAHNGSAITVRGGEPAGLKWILNIF